MAKRRVGDRATAQGVDDLAKGLAAGTVSRRLALTLFAAATFGSAMLPVAPQHAAALSRKARRRCRSVGGALLKKGACHCALTCTSPSATLFACHNNALCHCRETVSGKGFCAQFLGSTVTECTTDADCPTGEMCVLPRGCPSLMGCTGSADCPSAFSCIKGACQNTFCLPPCPT
jgi:hypothetical protein